MRKPTFSQVIWSTSFIPSSDNYLSEEGIKEVDRITWEKVGLRIRECYNQLTGRGWFDNGEYLNAVKNI
jgi:hypothetical protein